MLVAALRMIASIVSRMRRPAKEDSVTLQHSRKLIRRSAGFPALLVLLCCTTACNWGYGAAVDRGKFGSSMLHEDGKRCLFAFHDVVYRPAEGMRAFPDGGIPRYTTDRHKLGIINIETDQVEILVDQKNRRWLDGHGGFHVVGVSGRWGLIRQAGQREDYEPDHEWFRLDLETGDLKPLALDEQLAERSLSLGRVELVDPSFILILLTKKEDGPQQVWRRNANGELQRLATTDHYYGAAEGQIWWYDVAAKAGARTDYISGVTIRERRANFAMPRRKPTRRCVASFNGRALRVQEKVDNAWQERPLEIDPR